MTLSFSFNLPTDIPWKKICTTNDMMDRVVCDVELPPKWQSSIAMFKYVPADEYQLYPDYKITYLKATVTVTGYQPLDDEIQGEIDWDGVDITTLDGLTELLNSYYPCNGAILQIVVGPKGQNPTIPFDQYPFFFDFEPKKRELFEMATDTKEKQSRSVETLNITKGAGSAQSTEVMDVDMGGSWNVGVQGGAGGASGGLNVGSSTQGQWGTKSMDTQQNQVDRSQEAGTEKRETLSHTTQLSQLYHLLDSYHLGTNRAVFFMQPRPHVIEEPSGFVRGPRKLEGVQEFFMVVAQPKTQEDFCVSARLDTGHLIETDILDYERKTDISNLVSVTAPIPTRNDQPDGIAKRRACFLGQCWDVIYKCFKTRRVADEVYSAPDGFVIEAFTDLVNSTSNGSTSVTVAQGSKNLTIHVEAQGRICFEDSGLCLDCPDEIEKTGGFARRQVQVNLVSEEPSKKIGEQQSLLITTRGLCCCPQTDLRIPDVRVTGVYPVPEYLSGGFLNTRRLLAAQRAMETGAMTATQAFAAQATMGTTGPSAQTAAQSGGYTECECRKTTATSGLPVAPLTMQMDPLSQNERRLSMRQANGVNDFIRQSMVRSFRDPRMGSEPKRFIETDLFANQLESFIRRSRAGRQKLRKTAKGVVPEPVVTAVAKQLNTTPEAVTAMDVLYLRNHQFKRAAGMGAPEVSRVKLQLLGVPLKKKT